MRLIVFLSLPKNFYIFIELIKMIYHIMPVKSVHWSFSHLLLNRNIPDLNCLILNGDSRKQLRTFYNKVDLIVTSPPYADSRKKHYDSVHPDRFSEWFEAFHEPFWQVLKDSGNMVINIKDKVVNGKRNHFVWEMILMLEKKGWCCATIRISLNDN